MLVAIFLILGYLSGSIPFGVIVGKKVKGIDIRDHGSGNSGATNAYRVLGPKYGVLVLLLDALKGFLPVCLAYTFGVSGTFLIVVGVITILGHTLSVFLNFKGGKGIATSLGVFLFLIPQVILIIVLVFVLTVYLSKYISLGSILGAALLPLLVLFMPLRAGIERTDIFTLCVLVAAFIIYKHKSNIKRLMEGTENKFKIK